MDHDPSIMDTCDAMGYDTMAYDTMDGVSDSIASDGESSDDPIIGITIVRFFGQDGMNGT